MPAQRIAPQGRILCALCRPMPKGQQAKRDDPVKNSFFDGLCPVVIPPGFFCVNNSLTIRQQLKNKRTL
jgi:hypothetical protein